MLTDVVHTVGSWVWQWGDTKCEPSPTDKKVSLVGRVLLSLILPSNAKKENARSFSPLRLICWATLLYGASAQRTDPFPAEFDLSSLDGTNGFVIHGEHKEGAFGASIASDGDVNDDGIADILIGADSVSTSGMGTSGKTYVIFGQNGLGSSGMIALNQLNGINGFSLSGEVGDFSGGALSNAGDVNGDGIADLVIGAFFASPLGLSGAGRTYVVFGKKNLGNGDNIVFTNLNGQNGFVINGEKENDNFGKSVTSAGDVNGDGVSDLVVGAWTASPSGRSKAGKVFVIFGDSTLGSGGIFELSSLNGRNGFVIIGEQAEDLTGYPISSGGDVNDDGFDDILISSINASPVGRSKAGKTYVVFGGREIVGGGSLELSNLNGRNGFVIHGAMQFDRIGSSVSNRGDVNGDGVDDLIIGAVADPNMSNSDKTYVIFGQKDLGSEGVLELSGINGQNGFVITSDQLHEVFGISVMNAGDLNGDEINDLIIGAPDADTQGRMNVGKTYIVYGGMQLGERSILKFSNANNVAGFVINGVNAGDYSGISISCRSDVNGDGISDLLIGATGSSSAGIVRTGTTYVVFGRKPTQPVIIRSDSSEIFQSFSSEVLHTDSSETKLSLPLPIVIAICIPAGATALVCCIVACDMYFSWKKRKSVEQNDAQDDTIQEGNPMYQNLVLAPPTDQQEEGSDSVLQVSPSQNRYADWPQIPQVHDSSHYTDVDNLNRQHDQYVIDKRVKAQESYDDLNIKGGI